MKTKMEKLALTDDLETILICAERYACGRESYMPSLVISYITPLLPKLSNRTLHVLNEDMQRTDEEDKRWQGYEVVKGMRHGSWGDDAIDKPGWMRFWTAVKAEIERRNNANGQGN